MPPEQTHPFGNVPPEWVPLVDAMLWLRHRFNRDFSKWGQRLCLDIIAGTLEYKLPDSLRQTLSLPSGDYATFGGFTHNHYRGIIVNDWERANVDWVTGTVGDLLLDDQDKRERLTIKISWRALEKWAEKLTGLPTDPVTIISPSPLAIATAHNIDTKSNEKPPSSKGGRPVTLDWATFWIEVILWVDLNGLDAKHRSDLQKFMEDWTAKHYKNPPASGTIRNELAKLYKAASARNASNPIK